jgi:pca operon transcription factor PcaQ
MDKSAFRQRVRLRHIHCFLAVAEEGNLGKAAGHLALTQPAVSKTLSELEDIAGCKLFERNRQGARLTPEGENFRVHALGVLDALDAVGSAIGLAPQQENPVVRIGVLPSVGADLVPAALLEFRKLHPHAQVAIDTAANAALLDQLKAGSLDLVMGRMADPNMLIGLSFELLYVEPLCLVVRAGHPLLAAAPLKLPEIMDCPIVLSPRGTIPRHHAESFLQSRGAAMPLHYTETLSVSLARRLVMQSDAVWLTPLGAVRHDIAEGSLARLALPTEGTEEPVGLFQRSDANLSTAVRDLINILRAAAAGRRPLLHP